MYLSLLGLFVFALLTYIYYSTTRNYGIFEAHGIFEPPKSFPFGSHNYWKVVFGKVSIFRSLVELYEKYGRKHRYLGTFMGATPILVVNDVDVIRTMMIGDFNHFTDRRSFDRGDPVSEIDRFEANILTRLRGDRWKRVRSKLTPAFTSGKLKGMVPLIQKVGDELINFLETSHADCGEEFSVKEVISAYTLDCVASCGFGIEINSLRKPDGDFRMMSQQLFGGEKGSPRQMFAALVGRVSTTLATFLNISFFDPDAVSYFATAVRTAMAHKRKEKTARRGDLIDLTLEALEASENAVQEVEDDQYDRDAALDKTDNYKISPDEIETLMISNAIILFIAGFDTTASAVSMALGYLAKHQKVQDKLYDEVCNALGEYENNELDYGKIQTLPFLDRVVKETLRIFIAGEASDRECTKEYILPGSDFVVPKGMLIRVPSAAIHRDARYYPDPDNFNPDGNFSEEALAKRPPHAFFPFGQGPRNCIGMRFAMMMTKVGLVMLVRKFKFLEGPSMPAKFVHSPKHYGAVPIGGVWCTVETR